jgi:hypothetical protein
VSNWVTIVVLLAFGVLLGPLLLIGRLPSRLEAVLITLGMGVLTLVPQVLPDSVRARIVPVRDPESQSLFVPSLRLGPEPVEPQPRRAVAERHRARLERLRRFRYYPAWGPAFFTGSFLGHVGTNPWWWLLVPPAAALAVVAALEPFRLRRALARLGEPAAAVD